MLEALAPDFDENGHIVRSAEEKREELDDALDHVPGEVDEQAGFRPPSWWGGDEDAAMTSQLAARSLAAAQGR